MYSHTQPTSSNGCHRLEDGWGNCVHTPGAVTSPKIQNVQSGHQILWPCRITTVHKALTEETLALAEPFYNLIICHYLGIVVRHTIEVKRHVYTQGRLIT